MDIKDMIIFEDKDGYVTVQYQVPAMIKKELLRHSKIYKEFYDFTTLTFNATSIYQNKALSDEAKKYMYIVKHWEQTATSLVNMLRKMNAKLKYEIKKVQKRGM